MNVETEKRQDLFNYKFKCANLSDYKLILTLHVNNRLLMIVFNSAKKKLKKVKGMNVRGNPNLLVKFTVDEPRYFPLIKTAISKPLNNVAKEISKDGIVILNDRVIGCEFHRNKLNDWDVNVIIEGQYADKR